jgi:hypothetical protein
MTTAEILSEEAKTLPDDLAREVLDFMEFLRQKRHVPNQATIEAINTPDEEMQEYATFGDFLKELDDEAA